MKIGIITIHRSPSYGGSLQSYALYKYLEQQGHEVEFINLLRPTHRDYLPSRHHHHLRANKLMKVLATVMSLLHIHVRKSADIKRYNAKFVQFNETMKLSKTYRSVDALYQNPPSYDVYLTGSDQVWNPMQPYMIEPYFLTFVNNRGIKVSYAASVGLSSLRPTEKLLFKKWIGDYDYVSVREASIKNYLETFIDKPISRVADPTFLLNREYWKDIAIYPQNAQPYILLFQLAHNEELISFCRRLSIQSGLELIVLCQSEPNGDTEGYKVVNNAGPREFLGYIGNADMVITNSFHGTVFSAIMEARNFFTYIAPGNKKGSRITDLLQQLMIPDHLLVPDLKQTWDELSLHPIRKTELDACYHQEQEMSREFLSHSLQSANEK